MKKHSKILVPVLYIFSIGVILHIINFFLFKNLFNLRNFLNWDAEYYYLIKELGYRDIRVAFFPLFPMIWKLLNAGIIEIVLINAAVFIFAFYLLTRELRSSVSEMLLYLSIPSFLFFFLPYSESFFFLSSVILLHGLRYNDVKSIAAGLFLASLTRPAFTIFLPAIILTEFMRPEKKGLIRRLLIYSAVIIAGGLIVAAIQYADTGEWFKYIAVQEHWDNRLRIPELPFTSWGSGLNKRLDGVALLVGLLSGTFVLAWLTRIKPFRKITLSPEVFFSLAYLGGITLLVLLYRGGSLFSLNRFVFAVPFIIVVIDFWLRENFNIRKRELLVLFIAIMSFWLLFSFHTHIQTFLKFFFLTFYVLLIFALKSDKAWIRKWGFIILFLLNVFFQIFLYIRFLNMEWVG